MFVVKRWRQEGLISTQWLTKSYEWTMFRAEAKTYKRRGNAEKEMAWQSRSAKRVAANWHYEVEEA